MAPTDLSNLPAGRVDTTVFGNYRCLLLAMFMGFTVMASGVDSGSIGGFQAMVGFLEVFGYRDPSAASGWNIATVPQQIITSLMIFGSAIGALLVGPISSKIPRLPSIAIGCILMMVAIAMQAGTTSIGALYFARLLLGMGTGILQVFCVIYIQETAPSHFRSLSSGILQSFLGVGTLIGNVIDNRTANIEGRMCYQIPLFAMFAIPVIFLVSMPFLPESPRWLLQHGKEELALKNLKRLRYGATDDEALAAEFEKMKFWEARELEMMQEATWKEMFRGTNRRRTFLSMGVAMSTSGVGAMFIMLYSTYFFEVAGLANSFQDSVIVQCLGLAGTYISFLLIHKWGTKNMMLFSASVCSLSMLSVAVANAAGQRSSTSLKVVVGMISVYMFGFNSGIAIYSYPIATELPTQRLRAFTTGLSISVAFLFTWVIAFTAPYFINTSELNWGPKYGYIWFVSGFAVVVFFFFYLPDMSQLSLDDVDAMFEAEVPSRHFKQYITVGGQVVPKEKKGEDRGAVEEN